MHQFEMRHTPRTACDRRLGTEQKWRFGSGGKMAVAVFELQ
jgi:hypothetical protein